MDEFNIFDLMEIDCDLEFQGQNFLLHCVLLIKKVKFLQGSTGRDLTARLKNLTLRPNSDFNFHVRFHWHLIYLSQFISVSLDNRMIKLTVNIVRNINKNIT